MTPLAYIVALYRIERARKQPRIVAAIYAVRQAFAPVPF